MVEAEALGLLVLALEPLAALLGFDASDFIASEEEAPEGEAGEAGEEAEGVVEPGLADGDDDCAMADDSINPLSAVESNSFFNIGETSMQRGCLW